MFKPGGGVVKKSNFVRLMFVCLLLNAGLKEVLADAQDKYDPKKNLTCLITTDFYIVHLTTYQEPKKDGDSKRNKFEPYCQELPGDGLTYLAIDFIDRDLRQMPVEMRVVEALPNPDVEGEMKDGATIAHEPVKQYNTGVAQIQADFPKPGQYTLIVSVGDDMFADKIRIPLWVGVSSPFKWTSFLPYLIAFLAVVVGYGLYRFFLFMHNRKHPRKD